MFVRLQISISLSSVSSSRWCCCYYSRCCSLFYYVTFSLFLYLKIIILAMRHDFWSAFSVDRSLARSFALSLSLFFFAWRFRCSIWYFCLYSCFLRFFSLSLMFLFYCCRWFVVRSLYLYVYLVICVYNIIYIGFWLLSVVIATIRNSLCCFIFTLVEDDL